MRATPSKTARTMSARLDDNERLWKPPRMVWSSTGERSPFSQGVKRTPRDPGGTAPAISFSVPKTSSGTSAASERVVGEEHVVAQPGEAGAAGLVFVRDEVAPGDARRDGRDVGQRVGLLEGYVAADPARRTDVEVSLEVGHGTGPDGRRVQVPRAGHDRCPGEQAELARRAGGETAQHAPGRHQVGQLGALEAGQLDQRVVVRDRRDVAIVRHPVHGDGVVRGPGEAGEAQIEVVDGLEKHRRRGVHVGALGARGSGCGPPGPSPRGWGCRPSGAPSGPASRRSSPGC